MFVGVASRRMRLVAALLVLSLAAAAGCITPSATVPDADASVPAVPFDAIFDIDHDHLDPDLHAARWNTDLVANLRPEIEGLGWIQMGELDLAGDLLLVGINAGPAGEDASEGGFLVFDVSDATAPKLLHYERSPDVASCIGDVKAGPGEGQLVLATQCSRAEGEQARGFVVYDISDPAAPAIVTMAPPRTFCHMVDVATIGGEPYVYCAAQVGAQAWRLAQTPVGLQPVLANPNAPMEPTSAQHVPLVVNEFGPTGLSYFVAGSHDMTTQDDPLTGAPIVVISHSYSGVRILDGSDPTLGRVLGTWSGEGASSYSWIHTAQAIEIDGRRIVVAITENVVNTPPRFWIIDFTDYAAPVLLAEHNLAAQEDSHDLVYSLHNFQVVGTRMYAGTYHSGVWVLDLADPAKPVEIAYALSGAAPYPKPEGEFYGIGNNWPEQVWDVVVKDGHVFASDMASGLHVYSIAGDPVGDAAHRSFG